MVGLDAGPSHLYVRHPSASSSGSCTCTGPEDRPPPDQGPPLFVVTSSVPTDVPWSVHPNPQCPRESGDETRDEREKEPFSDTTTSEAKVSCSCLPRGRARSGTRPWCTRSGTWDLDSKTPLLWPSVRHGHTRAHFFGVPRTPAPPRRSRLEPFLKGPSCQARFWDPVSTSLCRSPDSRLQTPVRPRPPTLPRGPPPQDRGPPRRSRPWTRRGESVRTPKGPSEETPFFGQDLSGPGVQLFLSSRDPMPARSGPDTGHHEGSCPGRWDTGRGRGDTHVLQPPTGGSFMVTPEPRVRRVSRRG